LERQRRYDEKLLLILDKACEVFAEKGYHNTSVRDVAAATGVSPAGLYYYFQSKEELLHLILESCFSALLKRIESEVVGVEDPAARLRAIVRTHLDHFKRNGKEMRVLVHEWETPSGELGDGIRTLMGEYVRIITATLEEVYPAKGPNELRAATFGLIGMLSWVDQWYRPGKDLPLDLLAEEFSSLLLGNPTSTAEGAIGSPPKDSGKEGREWTQKGVTTSILSGPGF
jgi:AcrR family transcriptional regulator